MQTGWIQASRRVTRRLAWDPTCLPLSLSFPIKDKHNLLVLKSRRQYNLFLENYPAFKGLKLISPIVFLNFSYAFLVFGSTELAEKNYDKLKADGMDIEYLGMYKKSQN